MHISLSLLQTLAGISSEDDFYDVVDSLEEQKLEQMMDVSRPRPFLMLLLSVLYCDISSACIFTQSRSCWWQKMGKVGVRRNWVLHGANLLIVRFLQFHQKKRRNQDLLKEFKVYEVSGCGHTSRVQ